MSTGAECRFYEEKPGRWFYKLQCWPYGATEDYDTFGPFSHFKAAYTHLHDNHANPGGYSVCAMEGCPHDMMRDEDGPCLYCDRCGDIFDKSKLKEKV